jgi:hypothetical protein
VKASRGLGYTVVKVLLLAALLTTALIVSVVASVTGLTIALVVAALGMLVLLNFRHHTHRAPLPFRPRRAMLIAGLVVVGFFLVISIAGAFWPR